MTPNGIFQILLYTAVIIALAKPMGAFMAKVFAGERTWLHRIFRPVETAIYKICGIDEAAEQHWTRYAGSRARIQRGQPAVHLPDPAAPAVVSVESRGAWPTWAST